MRLNILTCSRYRHKDRFILGPMGGLFTYLYRVLLFFCRLVMRSSVCAAGIFLWTGSSRVMWSPASRFWMTVSSAAWPGKSSTCTPPSSTTSTVLQSSFLSFSLSLSEFCSVPYSTGTHHLELHCDCTVLQQHPSTLHTITQRVTTVSSDIWSAVSFQIQLSFFSDFSQLTLCWVLYCFVSASPLLLPLLPAPL